MTYTVTYRSPKYSTRTKTDVQQKRFDFPFISCLFHWNTCSVYEYWNFSASFI